MAGCALQQSLRLPTVDEPEGAPATQETRRPWGRCISKSFLVLSEINIELIGDRLVSANPEGGILNVPAVDLAGYSEIPLPVMPSHPGGAAQMPGYAERATRRITVP